MFLTVSCVLLIVDLHISQMYKVYRDPEGKSVMQTQQNMTTNYTFQCSEETYKEQIEKLREENIYLKNKVNVH